MNEILFFVSSRLLARYLGAINVDVRKRRERESVHVENFNFRYKKKVDRSDVVVCTV